MPGPAHRTLRPLTSHPGPAAAVILAAVTVAALPAGAVLTRRDTPTGRNLSPPAGDLAASGWQFQGKWGAFSGTAISPHYFITAKHCGGGVGLPFLLNGKGYTAVECFPSPRADIAIWRVREPMPVWAPLYLGTGEYGKEIVVFGRGGQRGGPVKVDGRLRGWSWDAGDGRMSWGRNRVSGFSFGDSAGRQPTTGELLLFTFDEFDETTGDDECSLSGGDSGGGVFLNDRGVWKLCGVNYAVGGSYSRRPDGAGQFSAALFDARGLYVGVGNSFSYLSPGMFFAQPSRSLATRLSANRYFIEGVLAGRSGQSGTYPLSRRQTAALGASGLTAVLALLVLRVRRRSRHGRR